VVHFSWRALTVSPEQVIAWIRAAFERAALLGPLPGRGRGARRSA
jgi:hypothetical protein